MELRDYQKDITSKAAAILSQYKIVYLAMEVRTGKTLTGLSVAQAYGANNVLFITKKKAIPSIESDYQKFGFSFDLRCINFESVHKIEGFEPDVVIIDEAHSLGAFPKPGVRTRAIKEVCKGLPIIYMSGTPTPESYSQIFHQLWVSSYYPFAEKSFYRWAQKYVTIKEKYIKSVMIRDYSKAKVKMIMDKIGHLMITCSQEEAGFESFVEEEILTVPMTRVQQDFTNELKNHKILHFNDLVASVKSGADLINKLSQVSGGSLIFDYSDNGYFFDPTKGLFIQRNFVGKKIAIFYKYRAELSSLQLIFPNWTDSPEEFNERDDVVFLGQIRAAREGVNLSTADALVMYNIDFSATSYWQARARLQTKDRKKASKLYWIFTEDGIEYDIYDAVQKKKNFTYNYYKSCLKAKSKKELSPSLRLTDLFASK